MDIALNLLDSLSLRDDEAFAITHILLNSVEEKVVALLFLVFDGRDVSGEHTRVLGPVNLDKVLFTRVEKEDDASLGLLAQLDAVRVNESCQLGAFVHVQKLNKVFLAKALNNLPGIVFGSRQLEQLHGLCSK